jgi:NTE family protein
MAGQGVHKPPRIGLALGSGAARGWAHIGVIKTLARAGIKPDLVCGTSMGALVGGAYLAGRLDTLTVRRSWVCAISFQMPQRAKGARSFIPIQCGARRLDGILRHS